MISSKRAQSSYSASAFSESIESLQSLSVIYVGLFNKWLGFKKLQKKLENIISFSFFLEIYLEGSMPQKPMALRNLTESSFYTINLLVETMANKVEKAATNFTLGKLSYTGGRNVWVGWFLAENQGNHQKHTQKCILLPVFELMSDSLTTI